MKYLLISLTASALLLFTGCSGKKYFEPEDVSSNIELNEESLPSSIKSMNKIGATLENNKIITEKGISDEWLSGCIAGGSTHANANEPRCGPKT